MKYRSRTEIVSQILEAANNGTTKTKIMYKAFLSYAQLVDYIETLTINGLLVFQQGEELYRTTEKGRKFMHLYNEMGKLTLENAADL